MVIPVIARVECRSEGAAEENPVAVWLGGHRHAIAQTVANAVVGGNAGEAKVRKLTIRLENDSILHLQRHLPDGDWRVWRS